MSLIFGIPSRKVYTDIEDYARCRYSENADKVFQYKYMYDETIFPESIPETWNVSDFIMEYYQTWDPNFLGLLVADLNSVDYEAECRRLAEYQSTEYIGEYGITGFDNYSLLAINALNYGVIYALTDGQSKIIYVELFFCDGFSDIKYESIIPAEYLPTGFSAKSSDVTEKEFDTDI